MNRSRKSRVALRVLAVVLGLSPLAVTGAVLAASTAPAAHSSGVVVADTSAQMSPNEAIWT